MSARPVARSIGARFARRPDWDRGRTIALLLIVAMIVTGGVLRAGAIGGDTRVSSDENGNAGDANSILEHGRYRTLRWPPGTPFLFAVATRLNGHRQMRRIPHSHQPAQYMQLAVEILMLILAALVAWTLAGPWAAVAAVALCAFYIPLIVVTRTYLSEPFGGLMILATFAAAAWARRRGWGALVAAGLLAGMGCLAREDLFPAVVVIAIALACWHWRASRRRALLTALVYFAATIVVITPWVIYASGRDGRFVPITDGGTDALFVGTYLPGKGMLYFTVKDFRGRVCRASRSACEHYKNDGSAEMFHYIASRHPDLPHEDAIRQADVENLEKYALGKPFPFIGMLLNKLWRMWSEPWSGGNGTVHPDTSRFQHRLFVALAFLGLFGGAWVSRRWSMLTVTAGLAVMTALNVIVNAQGRDNVRLVPTLFTFGAAGLVMLAQAVLRRRGASSAPAETALTSA
jgi:hypothetical protein